MESKDRKGDTKIEVPLSEHLHVTPITHQTRRGRLEISWTNPLSSVTPYPCSIFQTPISQLPIHPVVTSEMTDDPLQDAFCRVDKSMTGAGRES